jgi:hypothetical protein
MYLSEYEKSGSQWVNDAEAHEYCVIASEG